jgi:hypothetical protein
MTQPQSNVPPPTLDDLARAGFDAWCQGDCAATWEQSNQFTREAFASAARAVVLALADLLTDAYANQAAFDRWCALVAEAKEGRP